ncbi:uncharacterized protein LOC133896916 [Phragmites australis]|uniref:uncharacterized protein LOC133896916 n=1 Tax=Phragmites australis TaxID=29695 RepID=UPI002D7919D0|nr:uncharacterized protein LOC133896916 [Phragmites australis]
MALDAITSAVPMEMVASLAVKDSAAEAWEAVKSMRVGSESVLKSKAQRLRREFEGIRFKEGESVDDFVIRLTNLVAALSTVGETIEESKVVEKLLRVVPKRLSTVAVAIEVTTDLTKLSLEDVGGRLRAADEHAAEDDEPPPVRADGKLYLTEEQWLARNKERKKGEGTSGGSKSGNRRRKPRRGSSSSGASSAGVGWEATKDQCHRCGRTGHWARDCRSKPRNGEAHVLQAQEDEPTLLMARVNSVQIHSALPPLHGVITPPPLPVPHSSLTRWEPGGAPRHPVVGTPPNLSAGLLRSGVTTVHPVEVKAPVHLEEAKAFAQLDGDRFADDALWYLDTGATNHMTGSRDVFSKIDNSVYGTVRFGDGSVVNIEGRGTMLFSCKTGEHRQLTGVYHIPRLDTNLISIGQLDEDGYDVHINHGVMHIRDEQRSLLAWIRRLPNSLYTIRLQITRPVCLSVRRSDAAWHWHERFGHINFQALRKLANDNMVRGLPHIDHVDQVCD